MLTVEQVETLREVAQDWAADQDDLDDWNKLCDQAALLAEVERVARESDIAAKRNPVDGNQYVFDWLLAEARKRLETRKA